jgi:hypothetical protein
MLLGQKSISTSSIAENNIGIASGLFVNYGTSGIELDGYFELQTKSGLFLESSAITQITEQSTINTSIGIMNEVSPDLFLVGGYSNYLEISNSTLNEAFIGYSSNSTTGVVFFGLSSEISPNYLGIINLNSFYPKISFDLSITGTISEEMNKLGYDLFLNMTKTFDSGFTFGSSISSERYEDVKIQTFKKQGNEKTYNIPVILQGGSISFFMGWTF